MGSVNKRTVLPTITQTFLDRVQKQPNRPTFHIKEGTQWKSLTWKDFYNETSLISRGLMSLGIKSKENICLLSNTRLEWSATDMAILGAKAITVPIYGSNTAEDCAYIINHCEARFIFVEDNKQLEKILSVKDQLPKIEKIIVFQLLGNPSVASEKDVLSLSALKELGKRSQVSEEKFQENLKSLKSDDVFTICYTSGTTGVPKGVVLTHQNMMSIIGDVDQVVGNNVNENDIIISFLPISHIFGKVESMAAYHFGWQVYFAESIEKLFINIGEVRPTLLFAVPRIFEKVFTKIRAGIDDSSETKQKLFKLAFAAGKEYYSKIWNDQEPSIIDTLKYELAKKIVFKKIYAKFGGRLKMCIAGGAPLSKEIGEFMQIIGIPVLEGYGLTETCAPVTLNPIEGIKFGTIGKPLPEVSLKIANDGEILVKSKKVFKEYYKNLEATAEVKTPDGWFHTGDIGVIDEKGYIRITDRKKDLIVTSGGKNVAPQKIENLAKISKYISQAMVYGDKRNYLTALIVLEREEAVKYAKENNILFSEYIELIKQPKIIALVQEIINEINSKLPSYETIKKFRVLQNEFTIESGELTPSLKIRRRFCTEKYKEEINDMYGNSSNVENLQPRSA